MSKSHNKKRNIGIIYEQLLQYISEALVDGDEKKSKTATQIIQSHFTRDSELYKEFRLFNALATASVDTPVLANRILVEAKKAAKDFNPSQLRKEKSSLIKEINYNINDSSFYHRRVDNYRPYATIQTLLNDWRDASTPDISRLAKYENQICNWLLQNKDNEELIEHVTPSVNSLTVKIMREKFNKRYSSVLSEEQRHIIKEYVFSQENGDITGFRTFLTHVIEDAQEELEIFSAVTENVTLLGKINSVRSALSGISLNEINDNVVSKILTVSRLKNELMEGDNG